MWNPPSNDGSYTLFIWTMAEDKFLTYIELPENNKRAIFEAWRDRRVAEDAQNTF